MAAHAGDARARDARAAADAVRSGGAAGWEDSPPAASPTDGHAERFGVVRERRQPGAQLDHEGSGVYRGDPEAGEGAAHGCDHVKSGVVRVCKFDVKTQP